MTAPNIDDVAQTLAEYERLAISTGAAVQIDPPEFSADGVAWSPFWPTGEHPIGARATVHRDGTPTIVYVAWDESLPAEESWRALWLAKPMKLFGAYVVRAALRRAFRDAIGDRREPDEQGPTSTPAAVAARDWSTEIADATTPEAVHAVHAEMKTARAVTVPLERALRARLTELGNAKRAELLGATPTATAVDEWQPKDRPETSSRPAARDHLPPQNRAARRASSRRKGRR